MESQLTKKIVAHKNFNIKEGKLYLWNAPMFFFLNETLPNLQYIFEKNDKNKIDKIMYYTGKIQAKNGTKILLEKFGLKKLNLKIFLGIEAEQTTLIGVGKLDYKLIDENLPHLIYTGKQLSFCQYYKKLFGIQKEAVNHYMRGMISGANEAVFPKTLFTVETACIAKGDKECRFETKPLEEFKKDNLFKEQYFEEPVYFKDLLKIENVSYLLSGEK